MGAIDPLHADNLECGRCGAKAVDDVPWFEMLGADGKLVKCGNACRRCWGGWSTAWLALYPDWAPFCVTCHTDQSVNSAFETSLQVNEGIAVANFPQQGSDTKVQSGYTIIHNYEVQDAEAWSKLAQPGVTPTLSKQTESTLKDIRSGRVHSGIITKAQHKPFCEIQSFTTHFHEQRTCHLEPRSHIRRAQGHNFGNSPAAHPAPFEHRVVLGRFEFHRFGKLLILIV